MNTQKIKKIEEFLLLTTIIILPTFILTSFVDVFGTPKLLILSLAVLLILILKLVRVVLTGKMKINVGRFDIPLLIFASSYAVSGIFSSINNTDAFFFPGGATAVIGAVFFYFFANQIQDKKRVETALFASAVVLSIFVNLGQTGLFGAFPALPEIIRLPSFSPAGGLLPTTLLLTGILPLSYNVLSKQSKAIGKIFAYTAIFIILLGIAVSSKIFFPESDLKPALLDFNTSWNVATGALKEKPLLGFGPGGYTNAFTKFKPLAFNQTEFWNLKFNTARSYYLTAITETGLLGLLGILLLAFSVYKKIKKDFSKKRVTGKTISLITSLLLLIFFPATIPIIVMLFLLFSINTRTRSINIILPTKNISRTSSLARIAFEKKSGHLLRSTPSLASSYPSSISLVTTLPAFALIFYLGFVLINAVSADARFKSSLEDLSEGNISEAYDSMRKAIGANPGVDRYHSAYSKVSIALAENLAAKENLTEEERDSVTTLIQQSIREAKAAVSLNTQKASNWENLAKIYRSILSFAKGTDQFTIQSYTQAIALDPLNPNLRIALGGVYYSLEDYEASIKTLRLAVATKPDFANSHYNLALSYKQNGDTQKAIDQMSLVLSLVDKNSNDYKLAKSKLEELEGKESQETLNDPESLSLPIEIDEAETLELELNGELPPN